MHNLDEVTSLWIPETVPRTSFLEERHFGIRLQISKVLKKWRNIAIVLYRLLAPWTSGHLSDYVSCTSDFFLSKERTAGTFVPWLFPLTVRQPSLSLWGSCTCWLRSTWSKKFLVSSRLRCGFGVCGLAS